jgi:hypothetical protein
MNTDRPTRSLPPPPLEQLGALSSLLVHELSNHLCVIAGNATFAQLSLNDPKQLATAVEAIVKASEVATRVLARCGDLRRTAADQLPPGEAAEVVNLLREVRAQHSGWSLEVPEDLTGALRVPSVWVAFAAEQVLLEAGVERGALRVRMVAADQALVPLPPNRRFLEIRLAYQAAQAFSLKAARGTYERTGLLAAFELVRNCGGKIEGLTPSPSCQEALIYVPLVAG